MTPNWVGHLRMRPRPSACPKGLSKPSPSQLPKPLQGWYPFKERESKKERERPLSSLKCKWIKVWCGEGGNQFPLMIDLLKRMKVIYSGYSAPEIQCWPLISETLHFHRCTGIYRWGNGRTRRLYEVRWLFEYILSDDQNRINFISKWLFSFYSKTSYRNLFPKLFMKCQIFPNTREVYSVPPLSSAPSKYVHFFGPNKCFLIPF